MIEHLEIADERTARVVRDRSARARSPSARVRRAIEIGTRVLDREDTAVEVDYVKRQFEQVTDAHREAIQAKNEEIASPARGDRAAPARRRRVGRASSARRWTPTPRAWPSRSQRPSARTVRGPSRPQIQRMLDERDEKFMRRMAANDEDNPLAPGPDGHQPVDEGAQGEPGRARREAEEKLDEAAHPDRGARPGSTRAARRSPRPRRPGRARAAASRTASTPRSSGSPSSRGDCAHAGRRRRRAPALKKGDSLVEIGAGRGPIARPDRLRGQGQPAHQARRPGPR